MSKRVSIESRVLEYFETAPLAEAVLVQGLVTGVMKRRRAEAPPLGRADVAKPVTRKRRARRSQPAQEQPVEQGVLVS